MKGPANPKDTSLGREDAPLTNTAELTTNMKKAVNNTTILRIGGEIKINILIVQIVFAWFRLSAVIFISLWQVVSHDNSYSRGPPGALLT